MDNDFLNYIMSLRQRAGSAGPSAGVRMNGAPNDRAAVDDPIKGANPQAMAGLQGVLAARMQGGRQMPMPMDAYIDLARRAGAEEEARRRAAAMLQQGQPGVAQGAPQALFGQNDPRLKALTDATGTNYIAPPVGR